MAATSNATVMPFENGQPGKTYNMVNIQRLPMPLQELYDWQYEGACAGADPEVFFSPESERGVKRTRREEAAKQHCRRCPVIEDCLRHAIKVGEPYGVWGGLSESERARFQLAS